MKAYLIYYANDVGNVLSLLEDKKDVNLVLENLPDDLTTADIAVKEYIIDDYDKDMMIYIPIYNGNAIGNIYFTCSDLIIEHLAINDFDENTTIIGLKINKFYVNSDAIDENGIFDSAKCNDERAFRFIKIYKELMNNQPSHKFSFANVKDCYNGPACNIED